MYSGATVFSQLMQFLPWWRFRACVARYRGDRKVKKFRCADHFRVMAFAQLTYRESLRDIEACLRAMSAKLYHMGIRSAVSRNNLANANNTRDWRIYGDFALGLMSEARRLYAEEDLGIDLGATVYALDSTTIDLCLSMFPWAKFQHTRGAVKIHTQMNLRGSIPEYIYLSDGRLHDVNLLDQLIPLPGAYYIMDRGYLDFSRLYRIHSFKAFFVVRSKTNIQFKRRYSHPIDRTTSLICDQTVVLTGMFTPNYYPEPLRRVKFFDDEMATSIIVFTNDFNLPAQTIADLYRARWKIELFFKWIKQHLRIKAFYGTSSNAVKSQIWIAITTYLLIAIVKKRLHIKHPLYTFLQVLSVSLFEKTPIIQAFQQWDCRTQGHSICKQLRLFE